MIINQATLTGLYRNFKTVFNQAFNAIKPMYDRVAMRVPSSTGEEAYVWLGAFPQMREWLSDRSVKNLKSHDYTVKNKHFELTIGVDRDNISDDKIGLYTPLVQEMGRAAASHPDELIFALLAAGFTSLCYDGQYFFDTDHPVGTGTVSNYGGGSGTAWYLMDVSRAVKPLVFQDRQKPNFVALIKETDENVFMRKEFLYGIDCRDNAGYGLWQLAYASKDTLDATNYAAARAAIQAFTNDEGKPLGISPNLLVVPPSLEGSGRTLLFNERDAAGATNPWKGTADLLVVPWLA